MKAMRAVSFAGFVSAWIGCGGSNDSGPGMLGDSGITPPAPTCDSANGSAATSTPMLAREFSHNGNEGWLASPAVADLDGDNTAEVIAARDDSLVVWRSDGGTLWSADINGRVWASPVVADLLPARVGTEIAVAARSRVYAFGADGDALPGFPVEWRDEMRSLASADIDGDGQLELVAATTSPEQSGGQRDLVMAWNADGSPVSGFPPNTSAASGCDNQCFVTGGYDQNLALGDVDGDGVADILATQDNAYLSAHDGTGRAFDADAIFNRDKIMGVRFLHDYAEAQQGYADNESTSNQAHFTNSAPAIADVDGDGLAELVVLASVQNANQSDRERGVALWVFGNDGTRPAAWTSPFHVGGYVAGLWDFDGTNIVAQTNQVTALDLDPDSAGPEFLFAGFDGRIHAVSAQAQAQWSYQHTAADNILTAGVAVADLSGDGRPEIVFATYSTDDNKSELFVLDAGGNEQARVPLPGRGSMAVPTIADVDSDGQPEILVALKDANQNTEVMSFSVAGAQENCLIAPTGRTNLHRSGNLVP